MNLLKEDPSLILRRKYRNILDVCGKGAVLFAAWSVLKGLMYIFLGDNMVRQVHDITEAGNFSPTVLIACSAILIAIELLLHLRVAAMALAEAKGKKTGRGGLVIAGLLVLISLYALYVLFWDPDLAKYYTLSDRLVSAFVELTSMFNLAEIILYSIRLRRLPLPVENFVPEKEED